MQLPCKTVTGLTTLKKINTWTLREKDTQAGIALLQNKKRSQSPFITSLFKYGEAKVDFAEIASRFGLIQVF